MAAAAEAAGACRTQEPTEAMVAVAASPDEAARACADILGKEPDARPWTRFVFADADVEVMRTRRHWRVRASGHKSRNKYLDIALDEVLSATTNRIATMDVQILHWLAHAKLDS